MILHTVNKSPFDSNTLRDCLRVITASDALLLIENGVYAAIAPRQDKDQQHLTEIKNLAAIGTRFYVLKADLVARGIQEKTLSPWFETSDDQGFVDLVVEASAVQSWY